MVKALRATGWALIAAGVLILLYLVYVLGFTNLSAERAQRQLLEQFQLEYGGLGPLATVAPAAQRARPPAEVDPGSAYAAMWFERPGEDAPIVHDGPLLVVEGVSTEALQHGPGHYPGSAAPGGPGNFAVSGHRTTYGAPFYHLDRLRSGDRVHVVDRERQEWVYEVTEQRVVQPDEVWVIGDDPLGTGRPTLTLTTCTPRFSAAQRLVVFAELRQAAP